MKAYKLIAIILAGLFLLCACEKQETPPADNPSESNPAPSDTTESVTTEPVTEAMDFVDIEEAVAGYYKEYVSINSSAENYFEKVADNIREANLAQNTYNTPYAMIFTDLKNIGLLVQVQEKEYEVQTAIKTTYNKSVDTFILKFYAFGQEIAADELPIDSLSLCIGGRPGTGSLTANGDIFCFTTYDNAFSYFIWQGGNDAIISSDLGENRSISVYEENGIIQYSVSNNRFTRDQDPCGWIKEYLSADEFRLESGTVVVKEDRIKLVPQETLNIEQWYHSDYFREDSLRDYYNCPTVDDFVDLYYSYVQEGRYADFFNMK